MLPIFSGSLGTMTHLAIVSRHRTRGSRACSHGGPRVHMVSVLVLVLLLWRLAGRRVRWWGRREGHVYEILQSVIHFSI